MIPLALLVSTFAVAPVDVAGLRLEPPRLRIPVAASPSLPGLLNHGLHGRMPPGGWRDARAVRDPAADRGVLILEAFGLGAALSPGAEYGALGLLGGAWLATFLFGPGVSLPVLTVLAEFELIGLSLLPLAVAWSQVDRLNHDQSLHASATAGMVVGMIVELATMATLGFTVPGVTVVEAVAGTVAPGALFYLGMFPELPLPFLMLARYLLAPFLQLTAIQLTVEPAVTRPPELLNRVPSWPSPLATARDASRPLTTDVLRLAF